MTETGSLLSLKAWKLKLRGCWVAFLTGTRFPEHSRCSGMPSISCGETGSHRNSSQAVDPEQFDEDLTLLDPDRRSCLLI